MARRMAGLAMACLGLLVFAGHAWAQQASIAHIDLMHIWEAGLDTPDRQGLLPLAENRGRTALFHANKALDSEDDGARRQRIASLKQTLDPEGGSYGLVRAAAGIMARMQVATARPDASATVRTQGKAVIAGADRAVQRAREALILAREADDREGAALADTLRQIRDHLSAALIGRDDDGDGRIGPEEGGLAQVRETMARIIRSEGL